MPMMIPVETAWGRELARWNTPRNRYVEDSQGEPLRDELGYLIKGMGAVGFEPYPRMLYKAQKNAYGKVLCRDVMPLPEAYPDERSYAAACLGVEAFNRRCEFTVHTEDEYRPNSPPRARKPTSTSPMSAASPRRRAGAATKSSPASSPSLKAADVAAEERHPMTDHAATDKSAHDDKLRASKKHALTTEQITALSVDEKQELIAELEAAIVALRQPVPEPYPKWVEIDGVAMVVQSPEEEAAKQKAAAEFKASEAKAAHESEKPHAARKS